MKVAIKLAIVAAITLLISVAYNIMMGYPDEIAYGLWRASAYTAIIYIMLLITGAIDLDSK